MATDTWWLVQVLIKCPNQMVRQMFQRLCIHVIQRLRFVIFKYYQIFSLKIFKLLYKCFRPTQRQFYLSVEGDNNDMDTDKSTIDDIPLNVEADRIGNASCVTRFIKSLLSLVSSCKLKYTRRHLNLTFNFVDGTRC